DQAMTPVGASTSRMTTAATAMARRLAVKRLRSKRRKCAPASSGSAGRPSAATLTPIRQGGSVAVVALRVAELAARARRLVGPAGQPHAAVAVERRPTLDHERRAHDVADELPRGMELHAVRGADVA